MGLIGLSALHGVTFQLWKRQMFKRLSQPFDKENGARVKILAGNPWQHRILAL